MNNSQKGKKDKCVRKPYLTGNAVDENTVKNSLLFFGGLVIVFFVSFVICAMTNSSGNILRLIVNPAVIILVLTVFFNRGSVHGAEAVARGEILWQKQEKGQSFSESEKKICYHPMKAFIIGIAGTIPFVIIAVILTLNTRIQTTTAGTLPGWMQAYMRRDEVAAPLVAYTESAGMGLTDILRIIVRLAVMPFVSLVGADNYAAVYWVEVLSPLILLIPGCTYGIGYLFGPSLRSRVHTAISENNRRRIRREKKERRRRAGGIISAKPKEPEKLN
jgi:hypothetical protein